MLLTVKYGRGTQSAKVADGRVIAQVGGGEDRHVPDVDRAIRQAIDSPVGPYLEQIVSQGDRVLVMTVDHTRPNPSAMLTPLLERIETLGGKPEIMIGLGNHRPMTDDELDGFLGRHDVHQNASRSPDQWRLGTTRHGTPIEVHPVLREFDKKIVVGFIEPHYIAGFSGGRKMILPAVSSNASITHNHFLTALHGPQLGRLEGNPVHQDMLEAALTVGVDWICDAVVNPDDSLHTIVAGDLQAAHDAGTRAARKLYEETVRARADIVICSAGGWPYDVDMVQAKKTLAPAIDCVKPGGVVILVGECERGWGASDPNWDLLRPDSVMPTREMIEERLRADTLELNWAPCSPGLLFSRVVHDIPARLIAVSALNEQLAESYVDTAADLAEALEMAQQTVGEDGTIIALHDGRRAMCRIG